MNIGQLLETHLGWAAHELGKQVTSCWRSTTARIAIRRELKAMFKDTQIQHRSMT